MVNYDSKQIEANLILAGFENIKITDINYQDEKLKNKIHICIYIRTIIF